MVNSPLVSVVVTSYNAVSYIEETLESVKAQTYRNLEVVVSDDASSDDTVAMARQWLLENADRFVRTEVVTVPFNTGVSANCNRSMAAANADWVKFIAGDDILLPNCIEDNIQHTTKNSDAKIIFSQVQVYKNTFNPQQYVRTIPQEFPVNIMHPDFTAGDQFKRLLISDRINFTPSYFFYKQALQAVGGYDERHRWVEDYPMWLKLTQAGVKLYFFKKPTVGYRQHPAAINNRVNQVLVKPTQFWTYEFRKEFVHTYLPWDLVWSERFSMRIAFLFEKMGWNEYSSVKKRLFDLLSIYLNPFRYISYLKKKFLQVDAVFYLGK